MRTPALLALAFMLTACSQSTPNAAAHPSPSPPEAASPANASASPSVRPSPTLISPVPVVDLPLSKVDFSCRLPVVTREGGGDFVTWQGGFLNLPAGNFEPDAQGKIQSRNLQQDFATAALPVLYGGGGPPFYDRALSRWVPAPAQQALADGSGYAYATIDPASNVTTVHVVSVATGSARAFRVSLGWFVQVADYTPSGVYLLVPPALGGPGEGVWILDPLSGVVKQLRALHGVWAVRDGYAWIARLDPRDKTVRGPMELPPANSVVRVDLNTGAEEIRVYRAGSYPWWVGFGPSVSPVVFFTHADGAHELRLFDQSSPAGRLVYSGGLELNGVQGDGNRLWFGSQQGIYLYRPGAGFQKVFAYQANPDVAPWVVPAGFCL